MLGRVVVRTVLLAVIAAPACAAPALVLREGTVRVTHVSDARSFRIESKILGETREISVVFPVSYLKSGASRRYPVAIVLDGEANVPLAAATTGQLAANGQIPEMIVLAIPNTDRLRDLTPPGISVSGSSREEGGDRFLDFIEKELLPAADRQFRGGEPRILIGHSSGGILTTYAAATRSTYRAVIAIDAPTHLEGDWLAKKLIAGARAAKTPLRYASFEARFGWTDANWDALVKAAPATWLLHRQRLDHESHETLGMLATYLGLRETFGDYSRLAAPSSPTTSILPYYDQVNAALGAKVTPPRWLLQNTIEDLLMEGRGAAAHEAYDLLAVGYGAPRDSADLKARIADVEKSPPPTETVEGLLATPFSSAAEARAYVGEWNGEIWNDRDEARAPQRLRIEIVDGKVLGKTIYPDAPPENRESPWQYFRVTPNGITWGFMNGMRPRGMILSEGTLEGDVLSGKQRWGGISFHGLDGEKPPVWSFEYRRVK